MTEGTNGIQSHPVKHRLRDESQGTLLDGLVLEPAFLQHNRHIGRSVMREPPDHGCVIGGSKERKGQYSIRTFDTCARSRNADLDRKLGSKSFGSREAREVLPMRQFGMALMPLSGSTRVRLTAPPSHPSARHR